MKILIDNGHGSDTAGKRSPDGVYREYQWAREIAAGVVAALQQRGYDATLLTPETNDVSLVERVRRANAACDAVGAQNVVLVSIHSNAGGMGDCWSSARGWCAYTSIGQTRADALATELYVAAARNFTGKTLRRNPIDGDDDYESNFYILHKTRCPAVLTENFFHDNKQDLAYIMSEEGKAAVVKVHVEGITEWILKYGKH